MLCPYVDHDLVSCFLSIAITSGLFCVFHAIAASDLSIQTLHHVDMSSWLTEYLPCANLFASGHGLVPKTPFAMIHTIEHRRCCRSLFRSVSGALLLALFCGVQMPFTTFVFCRVFQISLFQLL